MNVRHLKQIIENLSDDTEIFVDFGIGVFDVTSIDHNFDDTLVFNAGTCLNAEMD